MEIYLVGGAVRDELLGKPVSERDWVVVGGTPEEMIAKGYQPVGKDFPVFLHPKTHEEYALARTERKTGKGYKGFHFYATPDVTLTEDLIRRDLTINAMAKHKITGDIIDPHGGRDDLAKKIFRHVSPAFAEDPVRILRVARFACVLPDFQVDPSTNELMRHMVNSGEVDALVAERVWKELSRALCAENPLRFFDVLKNCDALVVLLPEFKDELDLFALKNAVKITTDGTIRFAALLHHLSRDEIQSICKRYRVPSEFSELALLISKFFENYLRLDPKDPEQLLFILKSVDAFRRPERFELWMTACHAIDATHDHTNILLRALSTAKQVDLQPLLDQKLQGKAFADALHVLQIKAISLSL